MAHPLPIVFLHGALGDHQQMTGLAQCWGPNVLCLAPDFPGHGRDVEDRPMTVDALVTFLHSYLSSVSAGPVRVLGFSMGGYVATLCAARYPHLISEIVTYGTKWHWSPQIALKEVSMLDIPKIEAKVPAFASHLSQIHSGTGWKTVVAKTAEMMKDLGNRHDSFVNELSTVKIPILILRGSNDKMVSEQESLEMTTQLSSALYSEIPEWPHSIDQVNSNELFSIIVQQRFLIPADPNTQ